MNLTYRTDYGNVNSTAFKTKAAEIQLAILAILQSKGVVGVKITSLSNVTGGVMVQIVIALNNSNIDMSNISTAINNAIVNNQLTSIKATGTVNVQGTVSLNFPHSLNLALIKSLNKGFVLSKSKTF